MRCLQNLRTDTGCLPVLLTLKLDVQMTARVTGLLFFVRGSVYSFDLGDPAGSQLAAKETVF